MSETTSRRVRFDGTVTLGNLLTAAAMAAGVMFWGLRLEGRVDGQDITIGAQREAVAEKIDALEKQLGRETTFMQESLRRIEGAVQRVEQKLDGKADKK